MTRSSRENTGLPEGLSGPLFLASAHLLDESTCAKGPFPAALESVCQSIEKNLAGKRAVVLLRDENVSSARGFRVLVRGAVSESWANALGDLQGNSVWNLKSGDAKPCPPILVKDVLNEAGWESLRESSVAAGIRGCWLWPVLSGEGQQPRAIFVVCSIEAALPTDGERWYLEKAARIVCCTVEKELAQVTLRESTVAQERRVRERTDELSRVNSALELEIRERKEMEKWLVAAREAALEGARTKSRFVANISHEIRTPVHAITGMIYALEQTGLSEQQRKYLDTMQKAADSLIVLLNDILDFSKVEAGKLNIHVKEFDLRELLEQCTVAASHEAAGRGLSWAMNVDPGIARKYRTDPVRIRQVLSNILNNAFKFTMNGGVSLKVFEESNSGSKANVRFEVKDTGIGVPDSIGSRIFEEFMQVDNSSSRKHGGVGLGLSICKKLIELLEGSIGFETKEGEGSLFWFVVPMYRVREAAPPRAVLPELAAGQAPRPGKILLVEDNPVNQEVTATLLTSFGHTVEIAGDGNEAISKARTGTYDLIIMDCQMPEMDGYQTTDRIREFERDSGRRTPIIAMTADAMKDAADRCVAAGMDDYLSKPVQVDHLKEKIQSWLLQVAAAPTPAPLIRIDESAIQKLCSFKTPGRPNLFVRLVEIYLSDTPARVERLKEAIRKQSLKLIESEAHYLKSSSLTLGATHLSHICAELEELGRVYEVDKAATLLRELDSEYVYVVNELKKRTNATGPTD